MYTRKSTHRGGAVVLSLLLVASVGSLAGCQTPAEGSAPAVEVKTIRYERTAIDSSYHGLPADRLEEAIAKDAARAAALSERFAGVPADRIEEQLAREVGE